MSLILASNIRKRGYRPSLVNSIVRNQINLIDSKLKHIDKKWGINIVKHALPTDFDIPGLNNERAKKLIYTQIITKCESAGYSVKLVVDNKKNKAAVVLIWESEVSREESETMDRIYERALNLNLKDVREKNKPQSEKQQEDD
jgi:hypothetical protein